MDLRGRNEYMRTLKERYCEATKGEKGRILDEYCRNTGQNRKYVINKFWSATSTKKRKKRESLYDGEMIAALAKCWEIFDRPCGQRLASILKIEIDRLIMFGELNTTDKAIHLLKKISPRTIDRKLGHHKDVVRRDMKYAKKKNLLLYHKIPVRCNDWDTSLPGQIEIDSVEHCGASTAGEYMHSISMVDIATGWWEAQAILGKGQERSFSAISKMRSRTPFDWIEIHPDNDSMFINWYLFKYTQRENLRFSRSRPYKKNDNCFIEQKNSTHIRRIIGYLRHDSLAELKLVNSLYENELRLYKNFFQPIMKLKEKSREKGRVHRKYNAPQTPFQQLIESSQVSAKTKRELKTVYEALNPAELKRTIDEKLEALCARYKTKNSTQTIDQNKKISPITSPAPVRFYLAQREPVRLGV